MGAWSSSVAVTPAGVERQAAGDEGSQVDPEVLLGSATHYGATEAVTKPVRDAGACTSQIMTR